MIDKKLITLTFLLVIFSPLGIDLHLPSIVAIENFFGGSAELIVPFYLLGLALGQLLFGILSSEFNIKKILIFSLLLFIASSLLVLLTDLFAVLLFLRFLQGVAVGGFVVTWQTIVLTYFQDKKAAYYFSWLNAVLNTVPVLSPLLGSFLLNHLGWQFCFIVSSGYALLVLLFLGYTPLNLRSNYGFSANNIRDLLNNKSFVYYCGSCCIALSFILCFVTIIPKIMIQDFGFSPAEFSAYFSFNAFLAMIVSYLAPLLLSRFTHFWVFKLGVLAMFTSGVLLILFANQGLYALMFFIAIGCFGYSVFRGSVKSLTLSNCGESLGVGMAVLGFSELAVSFSLSQIYAAFDLGLLHLGFLPLLFFFYIIKPKKIHQAYR